MKKLVLLVACAIAFAACDNLERKNKQLQEQNDSLQIALTQSNAELEQFMGTFSEIQEGFRLITEAEGRINAQREGVISSVDQVKADMEFIAQKMKSNREQITQLQQKLKNSNNASAQLKKTLEQLTAQLVEKSQQIEALQADLAARNIRIATLDETVAGLRADSLAKERTLDAQDKALNTAWFVYGTKKELKEQKILQKGDVLQNDDFNKDYFTQIDIRKDTEFKLYSKSAKLLTTHPEGSYILTKDSKGQYILRITDPTRFWSVSRYLVIQVRV
ncbi:MAG: hypothetical protein II999_00050 [Bacteroidaceae bacterium]|nr:hypothetical protein [Bacteroidaceae bacterium]